MKNISKLGLIFALLILSAGFVLSQETGATPAKTAAVDWFSYESIVKIIQAVGLLVGIVISAFQLINLLSKSRATLKTDLEIFKLLKPEDPGYEQLRKHVGESIANIYTDSIKSNFLGIKIYSWNDFLFGMFFLLIFPILTFYLYRSGYTVWAVVTGFFAFGGLGGILNGLDPKNSPEPEKNPPPDNKV